jgi:hypothetical protein
MHVAEAFGGGTMQMVVAVAEGSVARGHDALIAYRIRPETPERRREEIDPGVEWLGGGGGKRGVAGHQALTEAGISPSGWMPREELLGRLGSATAYLHWTA